MKLEILDLAKDEKLNQIPQASLKLFKKERSKSSGWVTPRTARGAHAPPRVPGRAPAPGPSKGEATRLRRL